MLNGEHGRTIAWAEEAIGQNPDLPSTRVRSWAIRLWKVPEHEGFQIIDTFALIGRCWLSRVPVVLPIVSRLGIVFGLFAQCRCQALQK
jgi:hypothetical protein